MSKFIKVTPKGEQHPHYVLANLRSFYLSHGATVEDATDEEVYSAEPAERPVRQAAPAQADEIARLQAENSSLQDRIAKLEADLLESQAVVDELRKKSRKTE